METKPEKKIYRRGFVPVGYEGNTERRGPFSGAEIQFQGFM